jgi:Manganese containing catalase
VGIDRRGRRRGALIEEPVIGGAFGEMSVTMQYLFQGWNYRVEGKYEDLLMDTATEEMPQGHGQSQGTSHEEDDCEEIDREEECR